MYRLQAAAIQHDLARVGIAIDIRSSEFQTLSADVRRGNFQLYTLQFVGVTDPGHAAAGVSLGAGSRRSDSIACTTATPTSIG